MAAFLRHALGTSRVSAVNLSAEAKSRLGYDLIAAVNSGRLRLHTPEGSAEAVECLRQLERCRAHYRPNRTLAFGVDPGDGHDDYVISLALTVAAAGQSTPRRAHGRIPAAASPAGDRPW